MKTHRARILAMQAVYQIDSNNRSLEEISLFDWIDYKIPDDEREFSLNLVKGVQEYSEIINSVIEKYSTNWKIERISTVSLAVLRISIYQLMNMDIPYKSVIDEAVRLAKEYGEDDSERFINGILDTYYREEIKK